jgi:hypothetical protein
MLGPDAQCGGWIPNDGRWHIAVPRTGHRICARVLCRNRYGSSLIVSTTTDTSIAYVSVATGTSFDKEFPYDESLKNIALYVLYLLVPLVLIVAFFVLESVLVLGLLQETRPMGMIPLSYVDALLTS